jgi:hypothetical protein
MSWLSIDGEQAAYGRQTGSAGMTWLTVPQVVKAWKACRICRSSLVSEEQKEEMEVVNEYDAGEIEYAVQMERAMVPAGGDTSGLVVQLQEGSPLCANR